MPDTDLGRDEIQALLDAATALKIPAESLKPINPFRSDMKSPTAQTIQMWLRENRPELAARMSGNSGHQFSLAATAAEMGLRQHDEKSHQEMMENSEVYAKQKKADAADWEARMMREMESEANKMAQARGYDPDSKIGLGNYDPRFSKYFNQKLQDDLLEQKLRNEAK